MAPSVEKLGQLAAAAQFDICTSCDLPVAGTNPLLRAITRLQRPDGCTLSVLKVLLSNACHYDCFYCANRAERRLRRHSFRPEELSSTFLEMHAAGLVDGLFLSSAIRGSAAESMAEVVTTAEILRKRHAFTGYIHLKVLPGAPRDCVERAVALADRVSVNMEAPTQRTLDRLATRKRLAADVIQRMHWIKQAAAQAGPGTLKSGQTTQFVVGVAQESDHEVLTSVEGLRESVQLRRAYFSAFRPVSDTPLVEEPPCPPMRQHRLYQADWLLREYGFALPELVFDTTGNLPLEMDPKLAFALRRPDLFPVEVNCADQRTLMRIPGIGVRTARRIIAARGAGRIASVEDLRNLGLPSRRALPFLLIDGRRGGEARELLAPDRVAQLALPLASWA